MTYIADNRETTHVKELRQHIELVKGFHASMSIEDFHRNLLETNTARLLLLSVSRAISFAAHAAVAAVAAPKNVRPGAGCRRRTENVRPGTVVWPDAVAAPKNVRPGTVACNGYQ